MTHFKTVAKPTGSTGLLHCPAGCDALIKSVRRVKVETGALYTILGGNPAGKKKVLGSYVPESEGANFWRRVTGDLHNRGLKDIPVACPG